MLGVNTMVMIKEIRKSRGLTAKELGELVGKAESTINLYENGKREPDFETLLKMSEVLNCSTDSLLGKNAALTNEEEHLLWLFRQFSSDRRFFLSVYLVRLVLQSAVPCPLRLCLSCLRF
jgi:transcriptional regulator with XRE-family HTH domain